MTDLARSVTVYFVGVFAAVLRKRQNDALPYGVRFLLPSTSQQASRLFDHAEIPAHTAFFAIPTDMHDHEGETFIRSFRLPAITDAGEPETRTNFAFYQLNSGDEIQIISETDTEFNASFGQVKKPTPDNCHDLSWALNMPDYVGINVATVDPRFMLAQIPRSLNVATANFSNGRLLVTRLDFEDVFKFIQPARQREKQIGDALKLRFDWNGTWPTVQTPEFTFDLKKQRNSVVVIGSAPLEDIANPNGPAHLCGEPLVHHEILYNFSKRTPIKKEIAIPVCVNFNQPEKHPEIGTCIPFAFMAEGTTTNEASAAGKSALANENPRPMGLSLHVGLNDYSVNFSTSKNGFPVESLRSSVHDANTMQDVARRAGFEAVPQWDDVLRDEEARSSLFQRTLQAYGNAIDPNGYMILTYSGLGVPQAAGGGGWCMFDRPLLFSELFDMLKKFFQQSVKILVIADACFSDPGDDQLSIREAKVLPVHIARTIFKQLSLDVSEVRSFDELSDPNLPATYFVSACGPEETTPDGSDADSDSLFTGCVKKYASVAPFDAFKKALEQCTERHPRLERLGRPDSDFDKLGPFRLPT
jgi:hypothetical protein